jgi:hypothetical protein
MVRDHNCYHELQASATVYSSEITAQLFIARQGITISERRCIHFELKTIIDQLRVHYFLTRANHPSLPS